MSDKPPATGSADVTELVGVFRAALVALLPVMDKAGIEWRDGRTYDPWENVARTLFASLIGSCVENAVPVGSVPPLAAYGLLRPTYVDRSFLVPSGTDNAAFLGLATSSQPFDEAIFVELSSDLTPSDRRIRRPLSSLQFMLAVPLDKGLLQLQQRITFLA
jgi:hypothetical protein